MRIESKKKKQKKKEEGKKENIHEFLIGFI